MKIKTKKESIFITVKTEGKQPEKMEVQGYSFDYLGLKFNVHKSHIKDSKIWNVSEYQTGMIVRNGRTKQEALTNFEAVINKLGEEKFLYFVEKNLNQAKEKGII